MEYKLVEIDGYFLIIEQSIFEEGIYEIIGYGKTELDAYKDAFETIYYPYQELSKNVTAFGEATSCSGSFEFKDAMNGGLKEVKEIILEDGCSPYSVSYDEETAKYYLGRY